MARLKVTITTKSPLTALVTDVKTVSVKVGRTPAGAKGEQGERGLQGIQGEKGVKGDIGLTGAQGSQGERGLQGITGQDGANGIDGKDGAQGLKGDKGDIGTAGADGTGSTGGGTASDMTLDDGRLIKQRLLSSGTKSRANWFFTHGLDTTKIIAVSVLVPDTYGGHVPPNFTEYPNLLYSYLLNSTSVYLYVSTNVDQTTKLFRNTKILVTYLA